MALKRTQYWNLSVGTVRGGGTGHGESMVDMESYLQPAAQLRTAASFSTGVASGFRVSATAGATDIQITTGTAFDAVGRLIALESGGVAIVDPTADPTAILNVPTAAVGIDGIALATASATGAQLVTVTWREVQDSSAAAPAFLHAPWLRLVPAAGFADAGDQVVLASVQLDGSGAVTALAADLRRAVGLQTGRLELRAPREDNASLTVQETAIAELRARDDGGVDIGPMAGPVLSVEGGTGHVVLGGGNRRLGVGTTAPSAALDVDRGATNDLALRLASSGPGWGSGIQLVNSSAGAVTYGLYSGADGECHVVDVTAGADRLTIDRNGDVAVAGSAHVKGSLEITGDSLLGSGANPVKVTSGWQGFPDAVGNHAEISNDTGSFKTLMIVGNQSAGIGRRVSVWDRLEVNGALKVTGAVEVTGDSLLGTGVNPVKVTSGWQGFPDAVGNHAEISNDTGSFKTLMIVGNRSAGIGRRVSVWDRLEVNGDMTITSRLGVLGQPATPHNAGLAGGIHTWDLEAEGTIWCRGDVVANRFRSSFGDVAEQFWAAEHLEPGDLVGLDTEGSLRATCGSGDTTVVGIVSTAPGMTLNANPVLDTTPTDVAAVALCGRVRCKVTSENGPVLPGDLLVPSSTRGHAMRAGHGNPTARGSTVGKALQGMDTARGLIEVLVLMA